MPIKNIFDAIPDVLHAEVFEDLVRTDSVRIERILSRGQIAPSEGWFDQSEHEWVVVQTGRAALEFEDGRRVVLAAGDFLQIPAHCRHRVIWTDPEKVTVWLAVFYQ